MSTPELDAVSQTLCYRLVVIISENVARVLHEANVPPDPERHAQAQTMIADLTIEFIQKLRREPVGLPIERQDVWMGGATLLVLRDVWGIEFPGEPTEQRRTPPPLN